MMNRCDRDVSHNLLIDLSGNIIAALDRDASGTFNAGDLALDVQDNVTSVTYNASNDVFTFIV